jgi:hypothetical protein
MARRLSRLEGRSVIPADAEVIELATRCSVSRARHQRDPESVATD